MPDTAFDRLMKFIMAVGVIGGLFFTGFQLRSSAETASAALVYQIQRDGRDILKMASANNDYSRCVELGQSCSEEELNRAYNGIRLVLQFYASVYNQYRMNALAEDYWVSWQSEICRYTQLPAVQGFWAKLGSSYSDAFQEVIGTC